MDFSMIRHARIATKNFALTLVVAAMAGCSSGSDDSLVTPNAQQPPTSPSNPPANNSPVISGTPATSVQVGVMYTFQPTATDAETASSQLDFTVNGCPIWATCVNGMGTNAGRISGSPQSGHVGTYSGISISVRDAQGNTTTSPAFSITVTAAPAVNQPPTFTNTPPTSVQVNTMYSFTPMVNDPDTAPTGRSFTFSSTFPTWITTRNASTGLISGTPVAGQEGTYSNLRITVFDGTNSVTLGPFSITVSPLQTTNRPPAISGMPTTSIIAGQSYSFVPTSSDPDGDTANGGGLVFSINVTPPWASFNTLTGELSGPATAGTTSNIIISVRDPQGATAALAPFSLNVQAATPTGTATVSWTAPTTNTDTSQLMDLAGFRVVYGNSPSSLSQSSPRIANAGATSYVVSGLASGTWYFAVVAYNVPMVESDLSNIVSKVIP